MKINFPPDSCIKSQLSIGNIFAIGFSFLFQNHSEAEPFKSLQTSHVKVRFDYLEFIYFFGKNKDDLNKLVPETTQDMEGKLPLRRWQRNMRFLHMTQQ